MATIIAGPYWRRQLTSGVGLVTVTVVASNLLRILSTLVLTRFLSPEDFGVVGITAAILAVLMMISELGFGVFIIQHAKGDEPRFLDVVWTVRLVRSMVLAIGLALAAGPFAHFIAKPELRLVIAVTALHFVLEGCSSLATFTTVRQQKLVAVSVLDICTAAIQTLLGIALAVMFRNYWAMVVAGLAGVAVKSACTWLCFPGARRRLAFDRGYVGELWRFGKTIASAQMIQATLSQVDRFILSRAMPLNLFGLYAIASNLAGVASAFTSLYPGRVVLPAFARAERERPGHLCEIYYGCRRQVMVLYLFAMGGFVGTAGAVVDILYDPRYAGAALYLRLLGIAPLLALNNYVAREALIVADRVGALLVANIVRLVWLGIVGTAGFVWFGPVGLVAAVGTIELPVLFYCWFELNRIRLLRIGEELLMLATAATGLAMGLLVERAYFAMTV